MIRALHRRNGLGVVVLVDEYDKPILDAVGAPDIARANRDFLRGLYGTVKDCDAEVEFAFLTGVSKFSKAGLFSGLNNLIDLTVDPDYSAVCGYTDAELDTVFAPELPGLDREDGAGGAAVPDRLPDHEACRDGPRRAASLPPGLPEPRSAPEPEREPAGRPGPERRRPVARGRPAARTVVELAGEGSALAQLRARGYADKYRALNWPVHLIGVESAAKPVRWRPSTWSPPEHRRRRPGAAGGQPRAAAISSALRCPARWRGRG